MEIKPIETFYKGYRFRSRLEARWAVFFDALNIDWVYEPEGFHLGSAGCYLPDFFLKNVSCRGGAPGVWAEIKPTAPTDEEHKKMELLVSGTKKDGFILFGSTPLAYPSDKSSSDGHYQYAYAPGLFEDGTDIWWDNCMVFMKCPKCGRIKIEFSESNYMDCDTCGTTCLDELSYAEDAARSARFEHGEHG